MTAPREAPADEVVSPKRKRRWGLWVLWSFALLVAALMITRMIAGYVMDARLESRIDALRKAGEPVTFADFPWPNVPSEENAMRLYNGAFVCLQLLGDKVRNHSIFDNETGEVRTVEITSVPPEARAVLQLLRDAAARPACRPVLDLRATWTFKDLFHKSNLQESNTARRLLCLSSQENLAAGRPDEALEDVVALLKFARIDDVSPTLLTAMFHGAKVSLALKQFEKALDASEPSAEALAGLPAALCEASKREILVRAFQGERCFGLVEGKLLLDRPSDFASLMGRPESFWRSARGFFFRPIVAADVIAYLDGMQSWVAAAGKPLYQAGLRRPPSDDEPYDILAEPPWYRPMTYGDDQIFYSSVVWFHALSARADCARLAVALRLHRMKHGAYPDALDDVVGEFAGKLPLDPFTGKPYVYRRDGNGFIIYSLGPNAVDDSGVEDSKNRDQGDIVWKCSR